jgi:hypothetical protein
VLIRFKCRYPATWRQSLRHSPRRKAAVHSRLGALRATLGWMGIASAGGGSENRDLARVSVSTTPAHLSFRTCSNSCDQELDFHRPEIRGDYGTAFSVPAVDANTLVPTVNIEARSLRVTNGHFSQSSLLQRFPQFRSQYRGPVAFPSVYTFPFFPFHSSLVWSQKWSQLFRAREKPCLQMVSDSRALMGVRSVGR